MAGDDGFHRALDAAVAAEGRLSHRAHLDVALRLQGDEEALARGLRHVAASHGEPQRYHETLTRFWARIVAHVAQESNARNVDELVDAFPRLLDSKLPHAHWSAGALERGRTAWVEPDLRALPV